MKYGLSGRFLGVVSLVFSKFWHDARNPYEVVRDDQIFQKKNFLLQKLGEWAKNRVFEYIEKFCH